MPFNFQVGPSAKLITLHWSGEEDGRGDRYEFISSYDVKEMYAAVISAERHVGRKLRSMPASFPKVAFSGVSYQDLASLYKTSKSTIKRWKDEINKEKPE